MPAKAVPLNAVVRVRCERIALDGVVINGRSTVNQAPITGESLPVDKAEGDSVFAGTINEAGSLEYRVTAEASHSTLARIIRGRIGAGQPRPPSASLTSSPGSTRPSCSASRCWWQSVPPLAFGGAWMDWIYKALVLLVIACPCALVISTPVTIVSGLAAAARKGILVKGGWYLEGAQSLPRSRSTRPARSRTANPPRRTSWC